MKVYGRYGSFTPKPQQAGYYAKRAKRQQQERQARAVSLQAWLERHKSCANGCGQPVAFYDTIHYSLRYGGCGSVANSDTVSKIGLMYCQGQLR